MRKRFKFNWDFIRYKKFPVHTFKKTVKTRNKIY